MRRCGWCGVELRWWQINHCRVCRVYLELDMPSPPCWEASRWDGQADRFWGDYRTALEVDRQAGKIRRRVEITPL